MEAVLRATSTTFSSYPAKFYAYPGEIRENAEWTQELRSELADDLFEHLYESAKDVHVPTGNQFVYIEGAASDLRHVRSLLTVHLRRVLAARFTLTDFGRTSERIREMLGQQPFIDTTPSETRFRYKRIGIEGYEQLTQVSDEEVMEDVIRVFCGMARNQPELGIVDMDRVQRSPRWYETKALRSAVLRIIQEVVQGPVTLDLLSRGLEKALQDLDMYAESLEKTGNLDESRNVRTRLVAALEENVNLETAEQTRLAREQIVAFLGERNASRDITMLYLKSCGLTLDAIGLRLGVDEKTVRRRISAISAGYSDWVGEFGPTAVAEGLSQLFEELGLSGVSK